MRPDFGFSKGREVTLFVDTFSRWFEPENAQAARKVLEAAGYRVIDLGVLLAGPLIGSFLADFGADVVKLELPDRGGLAVRFALLALLQLC